MRSTILRLLPMTFGFALSLSTGLWAQPNETSARVSSEISRLDKAKSYGAEVFPVTFSTDNLFGRTDALEIDEGEAGQDDLILTAVEDAGMTPMGVFQTWAFPPSANAALTPPSGIPSLTEVSEALISCVPDFDSAEYGRLLQFRQGMISRLEQRFPSVRYWVVGYEPSLPFFDCSGRQLDLPSMVVYMADTLKSAREALRQANSKTLVVAHFLGASGIPIQIRGEMVQPSEILEGLAAEIERRGDSARDYYDFSITDFVPSLALDRFPEPTTIVPFSRFASLSSLHAARSSPWDGNSILTAGNWSTSPYWADYFTTPRPDLVGNGTDWNQWRTNAAQTYLKPSPVSGGVAHIVMGPPQSSQIYTVLGGATKPTVDVVPDEHFGSSGLEKNRWIAVMDFHPVVDPEPNGIHAGVFLRVNDRTWFGLPDQTRFGSIVWGGYTGGADDPACQTNYCGSLEFIGDKSTDPSKNSVKLFSFTISEYPWSFPAHEYRLQILEEERFDYLSFWTWWRAELVDLTDLQTVGSSNWVPEWTILYTYSIAKPGLSGSKVAIGFGPGQAQPFLGAIDADLVGTAYWIY